MQNGSEDRVTTLVAAIHDALRAYQQVHEQVFKTEQRLLDDGEEFRLQSRLMKGLADPVEQSKLFEYLNGSTYFTASSALSSNSNIVARWLFEIGRQLGAERAVQEMLSLGSAKVAPCELMVAFWGPEIEENAEVADGIFLRSDADLPTQVNSGEFRDAMRHGLPSLYLSIEAPNFPVISEDSETQRATFHDLIQKAFAIRRILITSNVTVPIQTAWWFKSKENNCAATKILDTRIFVTQPEINNPRFPERKLVQVDRIRSVLSAIHRLQTEDNGKEYVDRLYRAMERFEKAQARWSWTDQAIEMALAYEMILGAGIGESIGRAVSLRAAKLIGKGTQERSGIRFDIGALFHIRNAGAHGGISRPKKYRSQDLDPQKILKAGAHHYPAILEAVLRLGPRPNWDEIELS